LIYLINLIVFAVCHKKFHRYSSFIRLSDHALQKNNEVLLQICLCSANNERKKPEDDSPTTQATTPTEAATKDILRDYNIPIKSNNSEGFQVTWQSYQTNDENSRLEGNVNITGLTKATVYAINVTVLSVARNRTTVFLIKNSGLTDGSEYDFGPTVIPDRSGVDVASDDIKLRETELGFDLYVSINNTHGIVVLLSEHSSGLKVQAVLNAHLDIYQLPPKIASTINVTVYSNNNERKKPEDDSPTTQATTPTEAATKDILRDYNIPIKSNNSEGFQVTWQSYQTNDENSRLAGRKCEDHWID
jgi:hypothetical protein